MPFVRQRRAASHRCTAPQNLSGPQSDIMKSMQSFALQSALPNHESVKFNAVAISTDLPVMPGFRYLRRSSKVSKALQGSSIAFFAAFCVSISGVAEAKARKSSSTKNYHRRKNSSQPAGVWAWTAGSMTYLRARPGTQTPPIAKVPRHSKLMVWGKFDGWYRVETPDHKFGWVHNELLNSPALAKVQEMSHSKARQASNRTGNQVMYGSAEDLKKYYRRFGAKGAQKGLAALGVKVGPTKAQRLAAQKAAQQSARQKAAQAKYAKYVQQKAAQEKASRIKWASFKAAQDKQKRLVQWKFAQEKAAQDRQQKALHTKAIQAQIASAKAAQIRAKQAKAEQAKLAAAKAAQDAQTRAAQVRAAQVKAASANSAAKMAAQPTSEIMPITHPQIAQPKPQSKPASAIVRVAPSSKTPSGTPLQPVLPNSTSAKTFIAPAIPLVPKSALNGQKGSYQPPSVTADDLMRARQDHMKRRSSVPTEKSPQQPTKTAFVPQVYYLASAVYAPSMAKGDSAAHFLPTSYKRESFPSASLTPRLSEMGPKPLFAPVERTVPVLFAAKPTVAQKSTKTTAKTIVKPAANAAMSRGGSPRDYARFSQNTFGQGVANQALSYRGRPYIRGAASPSRGFDCSGLVYFLLRQRGYNPPRTAAGLAGYGKPVPAGQLQAGDLVLFANTYKRGVSHVGIYMGNNNFVHAATSGTGVRVDSLGSAYYCRKYWGARRVVVKN